MSKPIEFMPAPMPSSNTNMVTIPLAYFQILAEAYYGGRRENPVMEARVEEPTAPAQDHFVQKNWTGLDLLEDMPAGWKKVGGRKA